MLRPVLLAIHADPVGATTPGDPAAFAHRDGTRCPRSGGRGHFRGGTATAFRSDPRRYRRRMMSGAICRDIHGCASVRLAGRAIRQALVSLCRAQHRSDAGGPSGARPRSPHARCRLRNRAKAMRTIRKLFSAAMESMSRSTARGMRSECVAAGGAPATDAASKAFRILIVALNSSRSSRHNHAKLDQPRGGAVQRSACRRSWMVKCANVAAASNSALMVRC
jgi:hypothetical protein